ncbi:MAG: orotate phosphoribosyltransferase [Bacteroidetes bacterium]|nr:MAG: orotate phosphoribosyltransferase [Bacteroidota bacterium]
MILNSETATVIAEKLLQIKAIKLNVDNPFIWASGLRSPIYCDNRITLSFPELRTYIRQQLVKAVQEYFEGVDVIAGVATAGIPQGVLVAEALGLPFVYVRSSKKSHGLTNQIEGRLNSGQSVVVVEDLVSTGKSSLAAVDALREAGAYVKGMVAIFTYGLQVADDNFTGKDCKLVTLSDYNHLIELAVSGDYIPENNKYTLMEWRKNPQEWSTNFEK